MVMSGGTHPTGMHSCLVNVAILVPVQGGSLSGRVSGGVSVKGVFARGSLSRGVSVRETPRQRPPIVQ